MKLLFRSLLILITVLTLTLPAFAQLDPGNFVIVQNRRIVGEIFVPEREPGQTNYVEHWVLFPDYIYPASGVSLDTKIKLSRKTYTSEADFFARVPWGPGFRYVRIDATDTDVLPGR
ncbi:MAG: hypothetical protein C5B54_10610 [Acidobacteria bacterium]|nr:MAG: hypothetical protein C5B54_10610 [Acidobacteriota bacterium]